MGNGRPQIWNLNLPFTLVLYTKRQLTKWNFYLLSGFPEGSFVNAQVTLCNYFILSVPSALKLYLFVLVNKGSSKL